MLRHSLTVIVKCAQWRQFTEINSQLNWLIIDDIMPTLIISVLLFKLLANWELNRRGKRFSSNGSFDCDKTLACSQLHPTAKQFLLALRFFGSAEPQSFGKPRDRQQKKWSFPSTSAASNWCPKPWNMNVFAAVFSRFSQETKTFFNCFRIAFFRRKITTCKPWSTRNWFRMLLLGAAASWSDYAGQSTNHKIIAPHVKRWDLRQWSESELEFSARRASKIEN